MPNGGNLTVSVEASGNSWELSFGDTGPGMSPQLIEKVFEPFQSQFEGGTGLGLAIVYQIVQAHEGKVWARSKPGQGCVFVLRLARLVTAEHSEIKKSLPQPVLVKSTAAGSTGGTSRG
jgi:signal transduction histidine kinase